MESVVDVVRNDRMTETEGHPLAGNCLPPLPPAPVALQAPTSNICLGLPSQVRIFSPALPAAFALASTVRDGTIGPHNDDASNVPPGGNVHGYAPGASVIAAHKNISLTSAAAGDAAYLVASDDASTTGVLVEGASGSLLRCRFGLAGHTSGRLVTPPHP